MAKKVKTIQLQSPENYIRTRARSLEIVECLINESWKESGIANVVIARKHTNGNVTVAVYLVDLYCLGVKDSMFMFNISEREYREKLESFMEMDPFIKIDYTLAHNIIFAAIEFAGDFGFNPHKTFTSITQYMLEEDTEEIELVDIECGVNGKPSYFRGENDSPAKVNRILNQLERTAGEGNYDYTIEVDDEYQYEDLISETDDAETDEDEMSYDEAVVVFKKYESRFEHLKEQETKEFLMAVTLIFNTGVDDDLYEDYYDTFIDDLDIEIETEDLPLEMLSPSHIDPLTVYDLKSRLMKIMELPDRKVKKVQRLLIDLKQDYPEVPFIPFLEIYFDEDRFSSALKKKLEECITRYPDYPLIKLFDLVSRYLQNPEVEVNSEIKPIFEFFPGRDSIHLFEMQQYLMYVLLSVIAESNKSKLAAFQDALIECDLPEDLTAILLPVLITEKINIVYSLLNIST